MFRRIIVSILTAALLFTFSVPSTSTPAEAAASPASTDLNTPYGKFIIEDSQYYYYLDEYDGEGGQVYRTKKSNPSSSKQLLPYYVRGLTLVDGWLYFFKPGRSISATGNKHVMDDEGFYKMKTDGSKITAVKKKVYARTFTIVDNYIYYVNDSGQALRMTLNGSKSEQILKGAKASELFVASGWIYYTATVKGKITLNKSKLGSSKSQLLATTNVYNMSVIGDWIYYSDSYSGNDIYRIRTDGTKKTKLGRGEQMLVSGDGIYYVTYDTYSNAAYGMERYLYRMKHDGSDVKRISIVDSMRPFNSLGNKIFYPTEDYTSTIKTISKDGKSWSYLNGKPIQAGTITQMIYLENKGIPYVIDNSNSDTKRNKQSVAKAQAILKKIVQPEMTDAEKLKAVHDYIVLNTAYDYENYLKDTIPEVSYTVYGLLFKGVAVCDGYARTTKLFLDLLGIENYYVTGTIKENGEDHAWNVVRIDGKYVQVDATWDDPVPNRPGEVSYRYYMVTDKYMKQSRTWNKDQAPAAV